MKSEHYLITAHFILKLNRFFMIVYLNIFNIISKNKMPCRFDLFANHKQCIIFLNHLGPCC